MDHDRTRLSDGRHSDQIRYCHDAYSTVRDLVNSRQAWGDDAHIDAKGLLEIHKRLIRPDGRDGCWIWQPPPIKVRVLTDEGDEIYIHPARVLWAVEHGTSLLFDSELVPMCQPDPRGLSPFLCRLSVERLADRCCQPHHREPDRQRLYRYPRRPFTAEQEERLQEIAKKREETHRLRMRRPNPEGIRRWARTLKDKRR